MIVMALVVVGAASYFRLGVGRFPAVDLPTVSVRVELPGASSEEIETQLTQKLEEQINTIQGIQELRSISTPGNSLVIVTFALSRNIDVAAQDVRDKVSIAQRNLPREVKPPIISKFDNDQSPVLTEASLRTMGRMPDPKAFNDLVVANLAGSPVRVRDLGYAEDGTKEQRSAARLNGVPTVILEIRRQSGENTVAVIEGVKKSLERLAAHVPSDVKLEIIRDQSKYIYAALHEISLHLVLGSILASLVVLAFMRSWRSTFIAAVAIPTSVISAFGMMWMLNFTLNSVTMLALVLM